MKLALLITLVTLYLSHTASASTFKLENGYTSISGSDGMIDSMRFDPSGKGRYGRNHIISYSVGNPVPDAGVKAEIDQASHKLVLKGYKYKTDTAIKQDSASFPEQLKPDNTLGQTIIVERGVINRAEAHLPTWGSTDSAVTLSLFRIEGENKTRVTSRRIENIRDNDWVDLTFPDQPAGMYLLEISDVKGTIGWWSQNSDVVEGEATTDGQPQPGIDRAFRCFGYEVGSGDFTITLDGPKIHSKFTPSGEITGKPLEHRMVIPWIKAGYDTTSDKIIFSHFMNSRGLYLPVHQFKRRPHSHIGAAWVLMSGRFGTDLKFTDAPIRLEMEEDRMNMIIPGHERIIEVLPHTDKLSEWFPQFFSSDKKMDKVLNQFLLSHNFNFGVGTNPDWKEWHTLQLSWTANPECNRQRQQFIDHGMDPNGYVYSWGANPGWPFPFKDEDKDGKNDYDTRHFTTNPCFILGAWREYCWNPDPAYLAKILPRCRLAMDFMLKELDAETGVLTIHAKGHEGKDNCIGSNYWDILPLGYKDAFTNAHFLPCLEAMAQLEEATSGAAPKSDITPLSPQSSVHSPSFYRRLAAKAKSAYNSTFWLEDKGRYAGCIDIDGKVHDYGFTFINLTAMAYDYASPEQVKRIYHWMENGITSSGKADTYSRWTIAPRASTIHNPRRDEPQEPVPSWWHFGWGGTDYDEQCQDGGAILYTSYYDIIARTKYLGADNAYKRFMEILDRYNKPDHLSGGSPLYYGELTQGGPGGTAGSVGVEGEFPESGLVPVSFLYAFLGIDADIHGLKIRPNLPKALEYAGVRNLRFAGKMYDIKVTNTEVELKCTTKGHEKTIKKKLKPGETFRLGVRP